MLRANRPWIFKLRATSADIAIAKGTNFAEHADSLWELHPMKLPRSSSRRQYRPLLTMSLRRSECSRLREKTHMKCIRPRALPRERIITIITIITTISRVDKATLV